MRDDARVIEVLTLLPILHKTGPIVMGAWMPTGVALACQDVRRLLSIGGKGPHTDRRVEEVNGALPAGSCDVVLVAPGATPAPHLAAINRTGIIQATTTDLRLWGPLARRLKSDVGNVRPWRLWTNDGPVYGVMASPSAITRPGRPVPKSSRWLTDAFLPCLFVFDRAEVAALTAAAGGA